MSDVSNSLRTALAGTYAIERSLGAGGMASVFLAHDLKHDRRVALKVLDPELAAMIGPERFLREIHVTAQLAHPHILPLLDSGEAEGLLYYTMPVAESESLRERLDRERQLPIPEALRITAEVADALDYAHQHGVVHRDIKPDNILLHGQHALIADFGIARLTERVGPNAGLTATGMAVGTCQYMSPEQVSAEPVDGRSDVYSLACVTYEMLAGQPVFTGATVEAVARQHLVTDPVPISTPRSVLPPDADDVFRRGLAKTPVDRHPTPGAFALALKNAVDAPSGTDRPAGRGSSWRRPLAVIGLVTLLAAAVFLARPFGASPSITSVAVLPLENLSGQEDQYLVVGIHDALTSELAKLSGWRVLSRRSTLKYQDRDVPLETIATELGVDALMEGSLLYVNDGARLRLSLIAVSPERTVWSQSYERDFEDMLTLMRTITADVARGINLEMTSVERAHLAELRPVDSAALAAYMQGRFQWEKRSPEGFRLATEYFREAIEIDSSYARAWAGLSDAYALTVEYGFTPRDSALPLARMAADRAIALDSTLADAYVSRAQLHFGDREWALAERAFRRALALDANLATAHHFYGWFLAHEGRLAEALGHLETAASIDVTSPALLTDYAATLLFAGRLDDAGRHIQRALELQPDHVWPLWIGGILEIRRGDYARAMEYADRTRFIAPQGSHLKALVLALTGREAEARSLIREHQATRGGIDQLGPSAFVAWADVFTALDDYETALAWLERAVDGGLGAAAISLVSWPMHEPLRDMPRFERLIERMGYRQAGR